MKKVTKTGFSGLAIAAIITVVVIFVGLVAYSIIVKQSNMIDYEKYDFAAIIEGNEDNGGISDHVKGYPDAPVKIFEYADYQCPGCASMNPRVNKLLEERKEDVAVVYRNFLLSYHKNGTAAASAAEAAAKQGYWKEYADMLFSNQSNWEDIEPSERETTFVSLFETVSDGKGDVEQFKEDMKSEAVKDKLTFDQGIGKRIDVPGTPAFYIDGEWIDLSESKTEEDFYKTMNKKIDEALKKQKEAKK